MGGYLKLVAAMIRGPFVSRETSCSRTSPSSINWRCVTADRKSDRVIACSGAPSSDTGRAGVPRWSCSTRTRSCAGIDRAGGGTDGGRADRNERVAQRSLPRLESSLPHIMRENPRWGAVRVRGEFLALGHDLSAASVRRYRRQALRRPPSQRWHTFLANHRHDLWAADFFTVPTPALPDAVRLHRGLA